MKKVAIKLHIQILYHFLRLFYKKEYLVGMQFPRDHMTQGWRSAFRYFINQKIKRINSHVPWMCDPTTRITDPENIDFDIDYIDNFFNIGCYYQSMGHISIGKGTQIAQNVGIITSNHDFYDLNKHITPSPVSIGANCWIGMNSVILPGVVLGDRTIVGAGSIVTKSFPEGHCVICGNPAREIKRIDSKNSNLDNEAIMR